MTRQFLCVDKAWFSSHWGLPAWRTFLCVAAACVSTDANDEVELQSQRPPSGTELCMGWGRNFIQQEISPVILFLSKDITFWHTKTERMYTGYYSYTFNKNVIWAVTLKLLQTFTLNHDSSGTWRTGQNITVTTQMLDTALIISSFHSVKQPLFCNIGAIKTFDLIIAGQYPICRNSQCYIAREQIN